MNYSDGETDLIIADSIKLIGYRQKKLLLASVNLAVQDREKYEQALIKMLGGGVYNKVKALFTDADYRRGVLSALERRKVACVTFKSADYPARLKEIPAPPLVLYVRGRRELLSGRLFAVVGSRRISAAMREETKRVCAELAAYVTIVSGVADGGDSAAVTGALASGNVICVLPGGHDADCCNNVNMLKRVESEGLSVTEFPPETPVQRHTFTLRNRVMAGLSEGVLVVSAGRKSGALSTARHAAEYSREVCAFPYGIGAGSGEGCNDLIKEGAALCVNAEDVLGVLGIECGQAESDTAAQLDGDEQAVFNLLKDEGEMHAEQLAAALNLTITDIVTACSMLEIKGLIVRTGGNSFEAV
ncbi:MAG: DNA-protecting protein DprA [Roseburia sp.]|nr:DNA-protecting protein DprA [Roseburia sp.]